MVNRWVLKTVQKPSQTNPFSNYRAFFSILFEKMQIREKKWSADFQNSRFGEISKNDQKSKIFKLSHIGEFLSHEAPMVLIFSEIGHTLRLEQNKIPFSILKMIKNIKHPAAKRIKIFFPYLEKNAPLVKVLPINQKPLKMIFFFKNFILKWNFRLKRVEWAP